MNFKRIYTNDGNNTPIYIKIENNKLDIIMPSTGVINFDKDGFIRILNYMRGYDYTLAIQKTNERYYHGNIAKFIGYFVESSDNELIIIEFIATKIKVVPDVRFKKIDTSNGKVISNLYLSSYTFSKILNEAKLAGFTTDAEYIEYIDFVDKLPAETSAKRFTVYMLDGKYYILNTEEDALVEIEGNFYERPNFPAINPDAVENVIYNLTNKQDQPPYLFEQGLYTYTRSTNVFKLLDLKLYKTDKLPAIDKAKENTLYILTRNETNTDGEIVRAKGTAWVLTNNEFTQETRAIKTLARLPIKELAVNGVYYIINEFVHKFENNGFTKIGKLVKCVDTLPDVSTIKLDKNIVYTLTQDDGERKKGTNWIFDQKNKEFVAYVDPTTVTEESQGDQGTDTQPDPKPQQDPVTP